MSKKYIKFLACFLILTLIMSSVRMPFRADVSAGTVKQVKKIVFRNVPAGTLTLYVGQTYTLGTETQPSSAVKKVVYSLNKKNIVSVTKAGKIKALKVGNVRLTAKPAGVSGKKLTVKITVVKKKKFKKSKKLQ